MKHAMISDLECILIDKLGKVDTESFISLG